MEPVVLRTLRLELSVLTEGDAEALFAAGQDPAVQRYTSVPTPFTRADADDLIAATRAGWQTGDRLSWAVREQGVTGIFGYNDEIALRCMRALRARGFTHSSASPALVAPPTRRRDGTKCSTAGRRRSAGGALACRAMNWRERSGRSPSRRRP